MAAIHVVLRYLTLVHFCLLGQLVDRVGLLQQGIALVFLVSGNGLDSADAPVVLTVGRLDAIISELSNDTIVGQTLQGKSVNALDSFGFLRVDDELAVWLAVVA